MSTTFKIVVFTIFLSTFALLLYWLGYGEQSTFAQDDDMKTAKHESSPGRLGQLNWLDDDDNNTLSVSTEMNDPLFGNGSLRVDIKPTSSEKATLDASWSVVTTDFIPAYENNVYDYSLDVSAKDVNQLHSKVYYYNSSKMDISENFIFGGKDGTFREKFSKDFLSPSGTEYMQFQIWVKPTTGKNASYIIDNLELGKNKSYNLDSIQNISEVQFVNR